MNNITQDMKYRQSLVSFALKHGVSHASRKYNKSRSYIYFWLSRYDGTIESLACRSRRPKYHPTQHTEDELGLCELWCRMRGRGYTRTIVSMYRVLKRLGQTPAPKPKYVPKHQMLYPGQRVQIDIRALGLFSRGNQGQTTSTPLLMNSHGYVMCRLLKNTIHILLPYSSNM